MTDLSGAFTDLLQAAQTSTLAGAVPVADFTDAVAKLLDSAIATVAQPPSSVVSAQLLGMLGLKVVEQPAAPVAATADTGTNTDVTPDVMQCLVEGPGKVGTGATAKVGVLNPRLLENLARDLERAVTAALPAAVTAREAASTSSNTATQANATARDHRHHVDVAAAQMAAAPLHDPSVLHRIASELSPRVIDAGVGSKAWETQLGNQLTWMIDRGEQMATLRLSPEHLGPLEVRIAVRESEATVWFAATQPETRAALELAMPRLRDMLATQGIALAQSGVSNGSSQQSQPQNLGKAVQGLSFELDGSNSAQPAGRQLALGLVDLYA
jgi:flagellar hook-length control protein FliK